MKGKERKMKSFLEWKQRTPLSSRVGTRNSWSPMSGLKGVKRPATVALDLIPGWGTKIQSKKLNMKQTLSFAETVWMGHSVLPLIWADARTKL